MGLNWQKILSNPNLLKKTADSLMKKNYDLSILQKDQQYPSILYAIEDHFQDQDRRTSLLLPELNYENKTVAVFSDYGGESKTSNYNTYSFLICAWDHTNPFQSSMKFIRKKYDLNDKEIAFKDFDYGPISRALDDYLCALNMIPGLLFTVVIEKGAGSMNREEAKEIVELLKEYDLGEWKPAVGQKVILVCNIVAYLVALLVADNQKVFWMTDNDNIVANDDLSASWTRIFHRTLSILSVIDLPEVYCALPFSGRHLPTMDLLSSTDVVAGSIDHYFTRLAAGFEDFKEETNKVVEWLCYPGLLRKENIMIKKNKSGIPMASTIKFSPTNPDLTKKVLPIHRP